MVKADNNLTGRKVRLIQPVHGLKKGDILTISHVNMGSPNYIYTIEKPNVIFYEANLEIGSYNKEEISKDILELEKNINLLKNKLSYLEEIGSEEYDENEFKVYQTLKVLDKPDTSNVDKAKAIAKLINN